MDSRQKDAVWLGDENADFGPSARAALGILLERDDWSWWDDPTKTMAALRKAMPLNGIAKWGGDSSAADAHIWVDSLRALELGKAFNTLVEPGRTKIKILRSVWDWPRGFSTVGMVALELSQLVGAGHVFPEWRRNIKPRFPIVPSTDQGRFTLTWTGVSSENLPGALQQHLNWTFDPAIVDIAVADSVHALQEISAARLIVLYSASSEVVFDQISTLRDRLCAQIVVNVEGDEAGVASWLEVLIDLWVQQDGYLANSIEIATTLSGCEAHILSSTQSFLFFPGLKASQTATTDRRVGDSEHSFLKSNRSRDKVFDVSDQDSALIHRSGGKFDDTNPRSDGAYPSVERRGVSDRTVSRPNLVVPATPEGSDTAPRIVSPKAVRPSPPVERVLRARTIQSGQALCDWPHSGVVDIEIAICVKTPLQDRTPSFPDDRVEWYGDSKNLSIHLFELGHAPISQELILTRTGDSTVATFTRTVGLDPVDLRFIVSDGAQILQTARLQSAPGKTIHFFIENIVTPVHRAKRDFDVALLVNDSLGNQPSVTVITGDTVFFSPLSENDIDKARNKLLGILQEAVANPNASLAPLMLKLANCGSMLLYSFKKHVPNWPSTVDRMQLVSQSDSFFPIEYLYDGKLPESATAPLCPKSAGCLSAGKPIADCSIRSAGENLCPMGFLGVSGIVERHMWTAGRDARLWGAPRGNKPTRHRIEDLSKIAFTASEKADRFTDADVHPHPAVKIANIEASLNVDKVSDWSSWKSKLASECPSLLLLLVHLDDDVLYIGANSSLLMASISEQHVGNASVAIAIGCSSGLNEISGGSLPAILQDRGVRVVVAAMTNVLGRHANRIACDLAEKLRLAADANGPIYIGEILSNLRRGLLADGLALGLAVVAFGDADIVLGRE